MPMHRFAFVVAAAALLLCGCRTEEQKQAIEACVVRGVAYFKEVGSYPKLTASTPEKGRKAEDVARERCQRTTTAF